MGNWINPPEIVQQIGRKLEPHYTWKKMIEQINEGEWLTVYINRGFYQSAHLFRENEFRRFLSVLESIEVIGFYAVKKEDVQPYCVQNTLKYYVQEYT